MSVNAVLPRTIVTATTVFLALLALFFLGGHVIRLFSAAMIWGIFVATYSSIFICSPMLIYMGVRAETFDKVREKMLPARNSEGEGKGMERGAQQSGFAPGSHPIAALAGARSPSPACRICSILATPKGIRALEARSVDDLDERALSPLHVECLGAPGSIEFLVVGPGARMAPIPQELNGALRQAGLRFEAMATGSAPEFTTSCSRKIAASRRRSSRAP